MLLCLLIFICIILSEGKTKVYLSVPQKLERNLQNDILPMLTKTFEIKPPNSSNETNSLEISTDNRTSFVTKINSNETLSYIYAINQTERTHFLLKIHKTITRSKDAVWATITLTFMCVILVLAVAQSRMWKDRRVVESQGVPLPDFNERVLFRDVMERRVNSLKEIFKKKKKSTSELESLLPTNDWTSD